MRESTTKRLRAIARSYMKVDTLRVELVVRRAALRYGGINLTAKQVRRIIKVAERTLYY